MAPTDRARMFDAPDSAYSRFMGRYSRPLAAEFAVFARVVAGQSALDVGCGPGALTGELTRLLGAGRVAACDPSPSFVDACARHNPGVVVRHGTAEHLPFRAGEFDVALSQLVLHFVSDPVLAAAEMKRVLRSQGVVAACVWDFSRGMQLLRAFWDAALTLDPDAPDEQRVMRFGRPGEIAQWLSDAHLGDVTESTLTVRSTYRDFDELWVSLLAGVGPAGSYCVALPPAARRSLREALNERLGRPTGRFTLEAVARVGRGRLR